MHDEEWVQFAVVDALAKIKDYSAISALVKLLNQASSLVSSAIVDALGDMGDVKSIPLLFSSLENVREALRHKIVRAIVQILGGKGLSLLAAKSQERMRNPICSTPSDNDEDILMASLQGLSAIGTDECSGPIIDMTAALDKDRQDELYEAAIKAIAAIGYNDAVRASLTSQDEARILLAMEAYTMADRRCGCPISSSFSECHPRAATPGGCRAGHAWRLRRMPPSLLPS